MVGFSSVLFCVRVLVFSLLLFSTTCFSQECGEGCSASTSLLCDSPEATDCGGNYLTGFTGNIENQHISYRRSCNICIQDSSTFPQLSPRVDVKADFGAMGDGVADDTFALQRAINYIRNQGGGEVYLPSGTYRVDKRSAVPADTFLLQGIGQRHSALVMHDVSNVVFRCADAQSTIIQKVEGDFGQQATSILEIKGGSQIDIGGCGFDGNMDRIQEGEQAHGINIFSANNGATYNVRILDNQFLNIKGDGVRLVGNQHVIHDVLIGGNVFHHSRRSGIGIQRAIKNIWIVENTFSDITDQYVDFEPTGDYPAPSDILIADNIFKAQLHGPYALSVGGNGSQNPARRILVRHNEISGGVVVRNVEEVSFENNDIDARQTPGPIGLLINGYVSNVKFIGGKIQGDGTGVLISHHGAAIPPPRLISFEGVTIGGGNVGVSLVTAWAVRIVGSQIMTPQPTPGSRAIVVTTERPETEVFRYNFSDNTFENYETGILLNARSGNAIKDVQLSHNQLIPHLPNPKFLVTRGLVSGIQQDGNIIIP